MSQNNVVQVFEPITNMQLVAVELFTGKDGVTKLLAGIEAELAKFEPDTSTAKGRKDIASMAYKCSQSKTLLDGLGKNLVAEWKAQSALVDASRKIARDRLDALRDQTRKPLDDWEEAEAKRIAAEKLALELEQAETAARVEHDLWLRAKAVEAKEAEFAKIEAERLAKEAAEKAEEEAKEAAERAEAERKANEERIRNEATEKAKKDAEEAAKRQIADAEKKAADAQAAVAKAEVDRIAAEKKAIEDQAAAVCAAEEKARVEAERIEAVRKAKEAAEAEKAESERKEAEKKAADVEHRRKVNQDVLSGLVTAGLTDKQAKAVITAIVGGLVKHVSIQY